MKKYHLYLILGLLCSMSSYTVTAAALKIGFVNALKVMDKAPQVAKANKRLEKEFAPKQRKIVSARKTIQKMEKRLTKNMAIMSESAARKLSQDIREKKRNIKRLQEEFREDYNIRRNEELEKIQKLIVTVIQKFAKKKAYDLVITEGVIWASSRIDITDQVLKRLKRIK